MTQTSLGINAYQQLSDIEHVLKRPGMYIGTVDRVSRSALCYSLTDNQITNKKVMYAEGQDQVCLEILGNAADNIARSRENGIDPGHIEVQIDDQWVSVRNFGMNIPIDSNEHGLIPEFIFGSLRSSSNYDDTQTRYYIGTNGYGAKATNIFSKTFQVICGDPQRGRLYKQTWYDNMTRRDEAQIQEGYAGPGFTQINYQLDFARFNTACNDQEALEITATHCAEIAFTCQVPVVLNGHQIIIESITDYAKLFFPITKKSAITYKEPSGKYELCLIDTPDKAICMSFVNGIITARGGVHLDAAYKVVKDSLVKSLGNIVKGVRLTKKDIEKHVSIVVTCRIDKPAFDSQTKSFLKGPRQNYELPDNILNGIKNWELVNIICTDIERKQLNKLKTTDGRRAKKPQVDNLEHANFAGKARSMETTLILVEGNSAASYPTVFISQYPDGQGRDFFGILPLHGKLLNVINADFAQIFGNRDLKNIKSALALQEEVNYAHDQNFKKLNYGSLLVIPDADEDGKHILGLVLVFFMERFQSLVARGFIKFLRTPVVRVKVQNQRFMFYTESSFKRWMAALPADIHIPKDNIEYFKGLGSSEEAHVIEDFQNPRVVTFKLDHEAQEKIVLAFLKTEADQRKQWISDWVDQELLPFEEYTDLNISTFINHELIDFSIENVIRAIPEQMDGLKESQRKGLFAAFHKLRGKRQSKIKVAQVASHAAYITAYKHGEGSLADAIVKMTYSFTGSNNMPYFEAKGMFGTRNRGGTDAANPRYSYINLQSWIPKIFRDEDRQLERRIFDMGDKQECENYFPILPMQTINGAIGIGTAWSTNIPQHNPLDIAFWFQQRLSKDLNPEGEFLLPRLKPYYKGFTGEIELTANGFITHGIIQILQDQSILITELPVGTWTFNYIKYLDRLIDEGIISDYDNNSTDKLVKIRIHKWLDGSPTLNALKKKLKLSKTHSYNNMTVLYRPENRGIRPKIFNDLGELLEDFYKMRLEKYHERKALHINEITEQILEMNERLRFVLAVKAKEVKIVVKGDRTMAEVHAEMDAHNFDRKWLDKVKTREYTVEGIAKLKGEIQKKLDEKARLEQTQSEQIWYDEIEEFVKFYCRQEKTNRSTYDGCNSDVSLILKSKSKRVKKKPGVQKEEVQLEVQNQPTQPAQTVQLDIQVQNTIPQVPPV